MTAAAEVDRPLEGVGVVVTRDETKDGDLSRALGERGASVFHWPTIRCAPVEDARPLAAALRQLAAFDWVVFTSPRAVAAVADHVEHMPENVRVAAVGESTGDAARHHGWPVALVPATQTAEALVPALRAAGVGRGTRLLFPASEIAGPMLEVGLADLGAEVARVTAYRTLPAPVDRDACRRALDAGDVQVISFASPSAVHGLLDALGPDLFAHAARRVVMAVIGPSTAAAIRETGATWTIEASDHSLAGLVDRITDWARSRHGEKRHELPGQ